MNSQELLNLILMATVFGLVFSIWCICIFLWLGQYMARLQNIQKKLGIVSLGDDETRMFKLWRDTRYANPDETDKPTLKERLRMVANDAGFSSSMETVLLGVLGTALLVGITAAIITSDFILGIAGGLIVIGIFYTYLNRKIKNRAELFERQLVDALGVAARSLRAGHPLTSAFQLVSQEIGDPLSSVFSRIYQEQTLGLDLKDSVRQVSNSTGNSELKLFATSVRIQLQSGGNLADLMDSLSSVIRSRIRLNRKVRVLTAQTRFSSNALIAMPIIAFFGLNAINPDYMSPLYNTPFGRILLMMVAMGILLGYWVMKKMCVVKF